MGSNPYEAPRADITGGAPPSPGAAQPVAELSPELEMKAMELLGRKRSRSTGASFAVSWAVCTGVLALVTGLFWAVVIGGALAGVISKAYVAGQTPRLVEQVSSELGIPPGAFKPERYLL
jgi:hypothetical protein